MTIEEAREALERKVFGQSGLHGQREFMPLADAYALAAHAKACEKWRGRARVAGSVACGEDGWHCDKALAIQNRGEEGEG